MSKTKDDHAEITVSDTGSGMPKSVQSRAIQPFFTTRAGEGGTGLGLSIVYGFINQSGGKLEIDSQEGKGTNVLVSLPCADDPVDAAEILLSGTAMVVDDNERDRKVTEKALKTLGYEVQTFASAADALKAVEREAFDLFVSDFDLGGSQDGLDVLTKVKKHAPEARRILISGKSSMSAFHANDVTFVQKPVSSKSLSAALRKESATG